MRIANNLSCQALGSQIGVGANTISRWERGQRSPDVEMLVRLSQIFHCTVDDLLNPTPPLPQVEQGETATA
ncbi:helix-turn-helix domain-containing protein [Cloacibacillus sp.]|nr:helix-turn-helix domain-containing protein [Cloacibacillus sp.]